MYKFRVIFCEMKTDRYCTFFITSASKKSATCVVHLALAHSNNSFMCGVTSAPRIDMVKNGSQCTKRQILVRACGA